MRSQSLKFANDGRDPVGSYMDRLYLFWQCYVLEENLLADWHDSTRNYPGRPHHQLFESFLDAWGKGKWEEDTNEMPQFEKKSYFQTLGVVSHRLMKQIETGVLKDFLVKQGDTWGLRQDLSEDDRAKAEKLAKEEIDTILNGFEVCRIPSLENVEKRVEDAGHSKNCVADQSTYLDALNRMMEIEKDCAEIQAYFLRHGKVPPDSA